MTPTITTQSKVTPIPLYSLKNPYYLEYFIKTVSEIIKFYSSPHRSRTYSHKWTPDELGDNRAILIPTDRDFWNYNSPKISRNEFCAIVEDWNTYQEYARFVLRQQPDKIERPNPDDPEGLNNLYVKLVNHLENDWLFYRSYYKLFHNITKIKTLVYIDLAAYSTTRHFRFLMRKAFGYLEGNYVTSLQREGKVYIPHLQFFNESIELLYTSAESIELEHTIADYIIKENINSINDILQRFEQIANLKIDVGEEEKDHIFLNPSKSYIDREKYLDIFRQWLGKIGETGINFKDRDSIIENFLIETLEIPQNIFLTENYQDEDKVNLPSDYEIFVKNPIRAKRLLIRELFNDLLQYSINRYRFEERKSPIGIEERSEYENIFREYRNMTFLEHDIDCLVVECGEISFITLLWRYIHQPDILNTVDKLLYWGLIEEENGKYKFSPRAQRMARWCMKLMSLEYQRGEHKVDYNKTKISRSYANLITEGNLFSWMDRIKNKKDLVQILGEIIFPLKSTFAENEIINQFKELARKFYDHQDDSIKEKIKAAIEHSRFQKDINEFNRAYETINRTAIAFPISTIPTEVERKIRTFSIFIGSFTLSDQLDNDDEDEFEKGRRQITDMLNYAKIFYTIIGKPAAESASEAVIRSHARRHLEYTLGRYQHKVKNEGVYLVARMDRLWQEIAKKEEFANIRSDLLELKLGIERFSGTIHILNIATNGFQEKYLEKTPYCIIDVITESYCNAFQQFYTAGKKEEIEKLWSADTQSYLAPQIDFEINFDRNGIKRSDSKIITYLPEIENIKIQTSSDTQNLLKRYFDAEDITPDKTLISDLTDTLPQKIIMQSPFFEIFSNAFAYMSKQKSDLTIKVIITKRIDDSEKLLTIEVINPIDKYFKIDRNKIEASAGIAANKLFFANIGGGFVFEFDEPNRNAIARAIINFAEMEHIIESKGATNGFAK